jgi:hypothetical protein
MNRRQFLSAVAATGLESTLPSRSAQAVNSIQDYAPLKSRVFAHYYTWWGGFTDNNGIYTQDAMCHRPLRPFQGWYNNQKVHLQIDPTQNGYSFVPNIQELQFYQDQIGYAHYSGVHGFVVHRNCTETGIFNEDGEDRFYIPDHRYHDTLLAHIRFYNEHRLPTQPKFYHAIQFDSDQWSGSYNKRYPGNFRTNVPYQDLPFFPQTVPPGTINPKDRFLCDSIELLDRYYYKAKVPNKQCYETYNGRPIFYIFGFGNWIGYNCGPAIWELRQHFVSQGLPAPYIIGDFQVGHTNNDYQQALYYLDKIRNTVDAISSFTPFGGLGNPSAPPNSTFNFAISESPATMPSKHWERLQVGLALSSSSTNRFVPYFPGIAPQYFTTRRRHFEPKPQESLDGWPDSQNYQNPPSVYRPEVGKELASYIPALLPSDLSHPWLTGHSIQSGSYFGFRQMLMNIGFMQASPTWNPAQFFYTFVNSWNENIEGTMIEPTHSRNGEGYTASVEFCRTIRLAIKGAWSDEYWPW